ncbi:MAG: cupin domain-containing protein [Patescibacteria group bacterium]
MQDDVFENGKIIIGESEISVSEIQWQPHPKFEGVWMKHLIKGDKTGEQISSHIVKFEPGKLIDTHAHTENLEVQEVISGTAKGIIGAKEINYQPGTILVIPAGIPHKVVAGSEGVVILAKFTPALN